MSCKHETTTSAPLKELSFLVVGDWGRNGTQNQQEVANQMNRTALKANAQFVISTGDNFYESGVQSINDSQWETS
ncbi:MAG: acid phosphatase, partial [Arcicella sp.]|nr:acid phosphatase [Arcicella sp.]